MTGRDIIAAVVLRSNAHQIGVSVGGVRRGGPLSVQSGTLAG